MALPTVKPLTPQEYKDLMDLAKPFDNRQDFIEAYPDEYKVSRDLLMVRELLSHIRFKRKFKPLKDDEIENLIILAKPFTNRQEFIAAYPEEYKVARRKRATGRMFKHMKRVSPPRIWPLERLIKEAKKYKFRSDFQKGSPKAYDMAYKKGLLDEVCGHMTFKIKKTWDENYRQYLIKEISKCETYNEFILKFPGTLKKMLEKKLWLDILTPLLKFKRAFNSVGECTLTSFMERLFEAKFTKSYPLGLENKKGYQLELDGYNKKLRIAFEHNGHHHEKEKVKKNDRIKKKFCKNNKIRLLVTMDLSKFFGKEEEFKNYIKVNLSKIGVKVPKKIKTIKVKWIFPNNGILKHTYESLMKEARTHKTLKEFRTKSPIHYDIACHRRMMPEIKSFLVVEKAIRTDAELIQIAKKYNRLVDFSKQDENVYKVICSRSPEIYAEATSHMIRFTKPTPERAKVIEKFKKQNSIA